MKTVDVERFRAEEVPLSGHPAFVAHTPAAAAVAASKLLAPHTLQLVRSSTADFTGAVNAVRFRDSMLAHFEYGAELDVMSSPLERFYAINVPLSGRALVSHRGRHVDSGPGEAAVFMPTEHSKMRWSADFTVLCVTIDRMVLERHLERMLGRTGAGPIDFETRMAVRAQDTGGAPWAMARLLMQLAQKPGAPSPIIVSELETALMSTLLLVQPHRYSAELLGIERPAPRRTVDRAVEVMRSRYTSVLTVGAIAEAVGVGERSLQIAFRRRMGLTPMGYLRQLRLDHARRVLRSTASEQVSISQVAYDCGFMHLGRFADAYRRRFGERPSETARL
jgi:AraC-like DNA-binding protein